MGCGGKQGLVTLILKGHKVAKGRVEGEAVVSKHPISFVGGVDPESGIIIDKDSDLKGVSVTGKIFVFPVGKGSSGGSYRLYEMARRRTQPKGIINLRADSIVALGAIFADIPMVDRLDANPLELIRTGDKVKIDADEGLVVIDKAQ